MVPSCERNAGGTFSLAFTMSVSGPGQNVRAIARAKSGTPLP